MASITYLCRRGAGYYYRRRLYQRSVVNHPISISLGTADPVEARRLVPRLSARWEMMAMQMFNRTSRGFLQAQELTRIFRAGLDEELGLAMASHFDAPDALEGNRRTLRVLEATYRIAARVGLLFPVRGHADRNCPAPNPGDAGAAKGNCLMLLRDR